MLWPLKTHEMQTHIAAVYDVASYSVLNIQLIKLRGRRRKERTKESAEQSQCDLK